MVQPAAGPLFDGPRGRAVTIAPVTDAHITQRMPKEYSGFGWLGGIAAARVGARFRGVNHRGLRRWSTISTISTVTDADAGKRFAFEVRSLGIPVSRWQDDIAPAGDGYVVTESTWTSGPAGSVHPSSLVTGVRQRETATGPTSPRQCSA